MLQPTKERWTTQDSEWQTAYLSNEINVSDIEENEVLQEEDWPDSLNDGNDDTLYQEE